jgi:poly(3-hydroxybutyrate) depolymerase
VLVRFQSSESFGRLQYAGGGPLLREYLVDPQRVYIDGLSAGAAVAAIMGATYFGLFAAIGVHPGPRDVHFFEFGATNRYSSGRPRQGTNYDVENDRSRPTSSFL